jgi:hypothetical protein
MNPSGVLHRLLEVDYTIPDPGASGTIRLDRSLGVVPLVTTAAQSRTLPAPAKAGLEVTLYMKTDGGDCTVTVTGGYDESGSTTLTFSATGQFATLKAVEEGSNIRWRIVGYDGVTGPTVALGSATVAGTLAVTGVTTLTGNAVLNSFTTTVEAAEHGVGAIGTAATPATYRWTENGVIITQIKVDLTGLASAATANDVIGLAAGGVAYIGRNVVATNGIIFKTQFSCIETPAGGDNDVNVVTNASAALAYDGAGGTAYISNSGDLLAGQTIENLVPALTANDYFYLTAGTGDTAATYTAGMYVLTLYGHALLA